MPKLDLFILCELRASFADLQIWKELVNDQMADRAATAWSVHLTALSAVVNSSKAAARPPHSTEMACDARPVNVACEVLTIAAGVSR